MGRPIRQLRRTVTGEVREFVETRYGVRAAGRPSGPPEVVVVAFSADARGPDLVLVRHTDGTFRDGVGAVWESDAGPPASPPPEPGP